MLKTPSRKAQYAKKCSTCLNMDGEWTKLINKKNICGHCLLCDKEESQEHVTLCDYNKKMRDDQAKSARVNFKSIAKKITETEYEKNIAD